MIHTDNKKYKVHQLIDFRINNLFHIKSPTLMHIVKIIVLQPGLQLMMD